MYKTKEGCLSLVSPFPIAEVALMMLGVFEIRTFKLISTEMCSLLGRFQYLKRTTIQMVLL